MIRLQQKIDSQVQFWALLGPLVTLLTVILLLVKSSGNWILPSVGITGLLLCWKWRVYGLAAAVGLLVAWFVFHLFYFSSPNLYWDVGITTSLALSFIITALSFEEVTALVSPLQQEIQGKLESLWELDDQLKELKEREKRQDEQKAQTEIAFQAAQQEVLHLTRSHEKLLQDLFEARTQASRHSEELEFTQAELERLRAFMHQTNDVEDAKEELDRKKQELQDLEASLSGLREQNEHHQALMLEMSHHIQALTQEKSFFEEHFARLQKDYEALALQKADLSHVTSDEDADRKRLEQQIEELKLQVQSAHEQQNEYQSKIANLRRLSDQCLDLQMRNENLVRERNSLKQQNDLLQEVPRDARVANGKYNQLREQFEQKCRELDAARKELFRTQEQVEVLQIELRELQLADQNDLVIAKILAQADNEIASHLNS